MARHQFDRGHTWHRHHRPVAPRCRGGYGFDHGDGEGGPPDQRSRGDRSRTRGRCTSPRRATPSWTSSGTTRRSRAGALRGAGGRPMALKRFVDGAAGQPFFQKRAPENLPEFIRTATLTFPSGRTADEVVIDDAAGPRLGRQPRLHRPQSAPGPRRGPRPSGRAPGGPRPGPRHRVAADPGGRAGRPRIARGGRARRLAQDVRLARASTSTSGSSRAGRSRRSAGRRWRSPATSSAASRTRPRPSGGRRSATASSSTTTRTPRTGPSPPPTRSGRCPTRGCRRRSPGTRCPPSRPRRSRSTRSRRASPRSAIPATASTTRSDRSRRCWS